MNSHEHVLVFSCESVSESRADQILSTEASFHISRVHWQGDCTLCKLQNVWKVSLMKCSDLLVEFRAWVTDDGDGDTLLTKNEDSRC